jgi:VanZ family protein
MVLPPNEVKWLKNGPGLHFGDHGNIFSTADFKPVSASNDGCALEVWLEPTFGRNSATFLAFSTKSNPVQFHLRQYENLLLVDRNSLDEEHKIPTNGVAVEQVFRQHQRLLITVSSGTNGMSVYVDGKLKAFKEGFKLTATNFSGRLVFGDSPEGHQSWSGDLRGLAIYPTEISAERVQKDYEMWNSGAEFPADVVASATALYLFKEGTGYVTRSSVAGAPDLAIPARLETLRPVLLKPFWKEYERSWEYWADVLVNILAFVPFGFLFCGYLAVGGSVKRPLWLALVAGLLVSLTIELGQYYLPMRNSGTTDLITNTSGTGLGAVLFGWWRVRRIVEYVAGKWPFRSPSANG